MKRIVLLQSMPVDVVLEHSRWFSTHLEELGYTEGENLELIVLQAGGDRSFAEEFLNKAMTQKRPDLVATSATLASQVAAEVLAGSGIPHVFFTVSDPVGAGIIREIGVPTATNITGKVHMISRQTRVDMVMRLLGQTTVARPVRIGFIHSSYPSSLGDIRNLQKIAGARNDIIFSPFQVEYRKVPDGLDEMLVDVLKGIAQLKDKVDFWWEPSGPLGEFGVYTEFLLKNSNIAIVMGTKLQSVKSGALLHLTPNAESEGREAAVMADAILRGADPGKIPPSVPSSFDIGINVTSAIKHNIVVPPDLLQLAGKHVYR